ncbi:MAG: DoxX family protein [Chloroflexota bacterium]
MERRSVKTPAGADVKNPGIVRFLFNDPRMAPLWTIVRVLIGLKWLEIAIPKLSNPGWIETGAIVRGFWENQVRVPEAGPAPITYGWYRDIIQGLLDAEAYQWMAPSIVVLEVMFGVMFILGAFVGFTALAAAFLHWTYLMAGSAGNNGIMFPATVLLIAAWKVAGYYGLDYFLMRRISALWSPGMASDMQDNNLAPQPGAGD